MDEIAMLDKREVSETGANITSSKNIVELASSTTNGRMSKEAIDYLQNRYIEGYSQGGERTFSWRG